jgi:HSP20 family protein
MAQPASKVPVKTEKGKRPAAPAEWHPLETLQREIDRVFEDFGRSPWRWPFRRTMLGLEPLWRGEVSWGAVPAVDVVEKEKAYEITAELPGMDEKNIEIKVSDDILSITGEKSEEKEEKKKDYYLSERRYGSFERSFRLPEGVDADKIEASFKNGVLTLILPKKPEAQKPEKKIAIKAA